MENLQVRKGVFINREIVWGYLEIGRSFTIRRSYGTVQKFCFFTATQILREIKFGDFRGSKTALLAILEALNFEFQKDTTFESVKNSQ